MPSQSEHEPMVVTALWDLALTSASGALVGLVSGAVSEPLVEMHQVARRHALDKQLEDAGNKVTTGQDELKILQAQQLGDSPFAHLLQNQIAASEQQTAALQVEIKPFERANTEYILGSLVTGFLLAATLRAGYLGWRHHRKQRQPHTNS